VHRGPPLVDERAFRPVEIALPGDQALGEALEGADEQVLVGAEVVVDETVVDARLLGEAPRRNSRVADVDEQPLGGVEQRLFRRRAGTRLRGFRQRLRLRASRRTSLARPTYVTTVTVAAPAGTS